MAKAIGLLIFIPVAVPQALLHSYENKYQVSSFKCHVRIFIPGAVPQELSHSYENRICGTNLSLSYGHFHCRCCVKGTVTLLV
jgi:hypothetical protein